MKSVPVLAGVCGTDPFRRMDYFLRQVEQIGFSGVQNFPTVGLFDGNFRQNLEETGMGYRSVRAALSGPNLVNDFLLVDVNISSSLRCEPVNFLPVWRWR